MRTQKGFTLLEALAASGFALITMLGIITFIVNLQQYRPAEKVAELMTEYNNALGAYMTNNYAGLTNDWVSGTGVRTYFPLSPAGDPDPSHLQKAPTGRVACAAGKTSADGCYELLPVCPSGYTVNDAPCVTPRLYTSPLTPNADDLRMLKLLPQGFPDFLPFGASASNPNGAQLLTYIKRSGATPDQYNLEAQTLTDIPWTDDSGAVKGNWVGYAASKIGEAGGDTIADDPLKIYWSGTPSDNYLIGNYTGWTPPLTGGLIAVRAGFSASQYQQFIRRDGSKTWTGSQNVGGNLISNLRKVKLNTPCDGVNSGSAASKALLDSIAMVQSDALTYTKRTGADTPNSPSQYSWNTQSPLDDNNKSLLGAGYLAVCGFDLDDYNANGGTGGYIWKKATAGPNTIADAQAGTYDGYETNPDWACWAATHGTTAGDTNPIFRYGTGIYAHLNAIALIKMVMFNSSIHIYAWGLDGTWHNVTDYSHGAGIGFPIGYVWDWRNTNMGSYPAPVQDEHGWRCVTSNGDGAAGSTSPWKDFVDPFWDQSKNDNLSGYPILLSGWYFSSSGVKFSYDGMHAGEWVSTQVTQIPVTGTVSVVDTTNQTTLTGTITTAQTNLGTSYVTTKIQNQVFRVAKWDFERKSPCVQNGALVSPCN